MSTPIKLAFLYLLLCGFILPLAAAFPGNSLYFEQGDYVTGTGISTSLTNLTIECWVKHSELPTGIRRYVTLKSETAVLRAESGGVLKFYIKQSNGSITSVSATVLTANEWLHVAGTYNGTTLKIYLNGIEVGTANASVGGLTAPTGEFDLAGSGESMRGYIDDIRIWNTARTQTQIKENKFVEVSTSSSGLIHYWKLNESSGTTAADSKGSATGTLNNMTNDNWTVSSVPVVTQTPGNALRFDGTTYNYVSLNQRNGVPIYNNGTSNAYTVSMWVKGNPQALKCVYAEGNTTQTNTFFAIQTQTTGAAQVKIINNGSMILSQSSQAQVFDGIWHHIAWVDNNGTATLYVDGAPDGANFNYSRSSFTLNTCSIGARVTTNPSDYYTGYVDELYLWNTALTQTLIRQRMHGMSTPNVSNLVSMYQFNESSGSIVYDVGSGNNGTMINMGDANREASEALIGQTASGTISSNTTWSGSVLYVNGNVTVNNGVTLTINPGLTVFFSGYYKVSVQGRVSAIGTALDSIKFTGFATNRWHGFRFIDTPGTNGTSTFTRCSFTNATGGTADPDFYGSALYVKNYNNVNVNYCSFRDNDNPCPLYTDGGGTIYLDNANILIQRSEFISNSSENNGGAIRMWISSPRIEFCTFIGNEAQDSGGAISLWGGSSLITNCVFKNNSSLEFGGAISTDGGVSGNYLTRITNCIIDGNTADSGGGIAMWGLAADVSKAINCVVINNTANYGGGIYTAALKHVQNTVVWGNSAGSGNQVYFGGNGTMNFYYCNIQGGLAAFGFSGTPLTNNYVACFDLDPQISYSESNPGSGYVISDISPCLNAGDPGTVLSGTELTDANGNSRFYDNTYYTGNLNTALDRIDVGAIEDQTGKVNVPDGTVVNISQTILTDLYLYPGRTMTVNPGITLGFESDAHAMIYGNLIAVGTPTEKITFTSTGLRWMGFTFYSGTGYLAASSRMEHCIVENGDYGDGADQDGGNIRVWYYPDLTIKSSFIRNGYCGWGGAMYIRNSTVKLINNVFSGNEAINSGGALYFNTSNAQITNCTFTDNSSSGDGGAIRFTSAAIQPVVRNCIFWNNGSSPIWVVNGTLTDITHCNIEGGYAGTGNIDKDPYFTGETNHPYKLEKYSFCLNTGIADTTGLSLPANDLADNPRIYAHSNTMYNRVDMGAYEYQGLMAPGQFTASDGNNDYPGYVRLEWDYNLNYSPANGFKLYRNETLYETLTIESRGFSDYDVIPGTIYSYVLEAYYNSEIGSSGGEEGYIKPNGIISGNVKTTNNNPVMGVKLSITPSVGYCLQMNGANGSSVNIPNPDANLNSNFTLELWVKTTDQNVILFNTGTHTLSINTSGKVQYTDGINTITQPDETGTVSDNDWHHIAIVNDFTNNQVLMYLDETPVVTEAGFILGNYTANGFVIPVGFTGLVDDLRIWEAARDSTEIVDAMNIVVSYDSPGLKGYWAMNEGTGSSVYDATNNSANGSSTNCTWSSADPDIALGAITDAWGDYIITQIPYGSATTFSITPSKTGHMFQPEQRWVTLSASNIAANNIDFTDNSMIPISGYVKFQGTIVPVENAVILLNGTPALPRVASDDEGYYVLEVEHGTACIVSVDFNNHSFNRVWNLGTVTFPRSNINFEDTFRTEFQLDVVGGPDSYPIGDFDVSLNSVDGLYSREINGQNWFMGSIMVPNIPPLDYNVTVNPGVVDPFELAIDDQFQSMKTKLMDMRNPDDTLDTLRYEWRAPLQIEVAWPDSLDLHHFDEYPDNEFYVLTQNIIYPVTIKACEDYSYDGHPDQKSYLNDYRILINDEISTTGEMDITITGETEYEYSFAPYLPNIQEGYDRQYQKMIEFSVVDNALSRSSVQSDWAITQGIKPLESTYSTTSPEIPFLILHDPPGDGSYSSFDRTSSHTIGFSVQVCTDAEDNEFSTLHLGPDLSFTDGFAIFYINTVVDLTADFSDVWTTAVHQEDSQEQSRTFTTNTSYKTSESDDIIGDFGGDLFIGGALNLVWGLTKELFWDFDSGSVVLNSDVMVNPNGFATRYIYTESQIVNTVIPNLITIGDTVSADMWQGFLEMNEENKQSALPNPNHPANISFCSGPAYSYTEETTVESSQRIEFATTVSQEYGESFGYSIDGVGDEEGFTFRTGITLGESSFTNEELTTTTSFTLADDDVASDLTFNSDYFTVDIKKDPMYGTPVFNLVSGASSNHWEPNTQPRDGVMMTANTYTASDIAEDQSAVFLLYLTNTSQSNEPRRYYLEVMHATNSIGALVKINGVAVPHRMAFDLEAGQTVTAVLTVEPGPFGHELEGLTLEFYADGDRGYEGPGDHYFDVFKSFNVYWEAPYCRVRIAQPQNDWLVNQASEDTLFVMLTDYDLSKPTFKSLKLEYKQPQSATWLPALEIMRSELEDHPRYIIVPWSVASLSDGLFEIRACTTDSIQANWYTASLSGVIDRSSPMVAGLPQPADGILQLGDEISLRFNEVIDQNSILPGCVNMIEVGGVLNIDTEVQFSDNAIYIVPQVSNYWMENKTFEVSVQGLTDQYGNPMEEAVEWEFYVNANPVYWQTSKIELIKPLGNPMSFTTKLINSGGQQSSFAIEDLPTWLSATPMNGTLMPLDDETITFTISSQLGFGTFSGTLNANIPGLGKEQLTVAVSVLLDPPVWTSNVNYNYYHSMTITGQMVIDTETSEDLDDVIGAFILNGSGEYECRGVAHTEFVEYLGGSYQFFLTVYSDTEYGEPIEFRIWDASQCKEHYGIAEEYSFADGWVYGTPVTPDIVHASDQLIRDIPLSTGWTWISTNLLNGSSMDVNSVLESLTPATNDLIKSQTQYAQYSSGTGWIGSLTTVSTDKSYKIKLATAENLTLIGALEDPDATEITYGTGWNWVSYIPHVSISVGEALGNINNLTTGDMLKSQRAYAQYISDYGWVGSLRFLNPGEGYMLKTANSGAFTYPDYQITRSWKRYTEPDPICRVEGWDLNPLDYEFSSNITTILHQNGIIPTQNIVIGAFAGNQCRGIAQSIEVFGQPMYFLTVYANTMGETISFKAYYVDTEIIVDIPNNINFVNNQVLGNPLSPYILPLPTSGLRAPENVRLSVQSGQLTISWDPVLNAESYRIYSSTDPSAPFELWELTAENVETTNWTGSISGNSLFYRVAACTESRQATKTPSSGLLLTKPKSTSGKQ